jgi:hypothetical protein
LVVVFAEIGVFLAVAGVFIVLVAILFVAKYSYPVASRHPF